MKYYNEKDVWVCTILGLGRLLRGVLGIGLIFFGTGYFASEVLDLSDNGDLIFAIISTVVLTFGFITWKIEMNMKMIRKWNESNKRR